MLGSLQVAFIFLTAIDPRTEVFREDHSRVLNLEAEIRLNNAEYTTLEKWLLTQKIN